MLNAWAVMVVMLTSIQSVKSAVSHRSPALFIFGDSLVDVGNNNFLGTRARADFLPYGVDFGGPTGRFSNGRLVPDFISEYMEIPYVPPYFAGEDLQKGANFASAGTGILPSTGLLRLGNRLHLTAQVDYFQEAKEKLDAQLGRKAAQVLISSSIFYIDIGNNDIGSNYLSSASNASKEYTLEQFENLLLKNLSSNIKTLYNLGARRFVVTSLVALGCNPAAVRNHGNKTDCAPQFESAAISYNSKLKSRLGSLENSLHGSCFVFANYYEVMTRITSSPDSYGFKNVRGQCCGERSGALCSPDAVYCNDTASYVYWDAYHPTDAFNMVLAKRFWEGPSSDVSPINIKQLVYRH